MTTLFNRSWMAFIAVVAVSTITGCGNEHAEVNEHAHRVVVSQPMKQDVAVAREYVSQVHANRHIEMRALERGYLQEVLVSEGQLVEQGQLMFRILPVTFQAELQRAQAEASAALLEYSNTKMLAENNVVSATEVALAKAAYEQAQAEVDLAQAHLSFTQIRAPFAGIMDRLSVREGSLLDEGEFLTTLSDNSVMWIYFNVPEAEYLEYVSSDRTDEHSIVEFEMANGKRFGHSGRISVIEADFNNQTGTIAFRADFPNPEGLLRHGQTGNILMSTVFPEALLVPQKATFEVLDQTYVYVVAEDGTVHQRRIQIGEELEDLFLVTDGLVEEELIVLEGLRQVRDGDVIEYEFNAPTEVFASLKLSAE